MNPILQVRNLNVSLDGQQILERISFDVEKGDVLAVVGPNGAGKTVLFRALLGLIPYSGEIIWQKNIRIGYVPQKIVLDRFFKASLLDFFSAKIKIASLKKEEIEKKLAIVGFSTNILSKSLGELSFGQFQLVMFAFALLGEPDILLLDEPALGLDLSGGAHLYDAIYNLNKDKKLTVILVSHEIEIVYRYATKVLCFNRGLICQGSPKEVLNPETLSALFGETALHHHHHNG